MRLNDFVRRSQLLEICCGDCAAETPLGPSFLLARRGGITVAKLCHHPG